MASTRNGTLITNRVTTSIASSVSGSRKISELRTEAARAAVKAGVPDAFTSSPTRSARLWGSLTVSSTFWTSVTEMTA